jgi:hypothetical protein
MTHAPAVPPHLNSALAMRPMPFRSSVAHRVDRACDWARAQPGRIVALVGPTAIGKSRAAEWYADMGLHPAVHYLHLVPTPDLSPVDWIARIAGALRFGHLLDGSRAAQWQYCVDRCAAAGALLLVDEAAEYPEAFWQVIAALRERTHVSLALLDRAWPSREHETPAWLVPDAVTPLALEREDIEAACRHWGLSDPAGMRAVVAWFAQPQGGSLFRLWRYLRVVTAQHTQQASFAALQALAAERGFPIPVVA